MSQKSSNPQANQLVKEGIQAIRDGDKQLGRGKLEAAVQIDSYNEAAWFWLASVVETEEERRTCLGNVVIINPGNTKAQQMLRQLEERGSAKRATGVGPIIGGGAGKSPRRRLVFVLIAGMVLLGIGGLLAILSTGNDEPEVPERLVIPSPTTTVLPEELAALENATATAQASITPSLTPARVGEVPTWTPVPTASPTPGPIELPPPPEGLTGRIIMQTGFVAGDPNNQPVAFVPANNPANLQIVSGPNQRGQFPALQPGQDRFAWAQYQSGTRSLVLQLQRFGREDATNVAALYTDEEVILDRHNYPDWYESLLVFSAQALDAPARDIWLVNTEGPPPSFFLGTDPSSILPPIEQVTSGENPAPGDVEAPPTPTITPEVISIYRLTEDEASETWPRFSPNGDAIVYVTEEEGITEIEIVQIRSRAVRALTTNENALIESAPDWSNTGEIIFAASTAPNTPADLYIMPEDGSAEPTLLLDFGGNERQPRFSPDGQYVVFSSDRNGDWDVFILERATGDVFALLDAPRSTDIANDWVP